jgi:predicted DsbA family dithiol-disulfide isomerase
MKPQIRIDIVSDVVCPWCYIGKRRLEKAIAELSAKYEFVLEYHPFELNPDAPLSGIDQKEYLSKKFGGQERLDEMISHVKSLAAKEGLEFNLDKQGIAPHTRKAHSLIMLAKIEGKQTEVVEALFKAYFTDGVDLSQDKNLVEIVIQAGLSPKKVDTVLHDAQTQLQVTLSEKEVSKLGIKAVPFYIINERYGVSGAQSTEAFIKAFEEIEKEKVKIEGEPLEIDRNSF